MTCELLLGMGAAMAELAVFAVLVGVVLLVLWRWHGSGRWLTTAGLWLAYAVYEWLIATRVLCSGDCAIRVDLLLIAPLLLGRTLWVTVSEAWRARQRRPGADRDATRF
ncbi:MAG: hypothetical protein AUJ20_12125 [Comamonadaceae bacterium CG1_02_60_18]|nr:MAG: hypothetical protein AUJ20_12125 [Comamonadaceae bacterium CG1_02_60_18]PIQ51479.1 MAG: hypothetical protein COW02_14720 [Comamonadaceae bacterium CG12_big_fil_rev_8_21_14_0_65_59_15]